MKKRIFQRKQKKAKRKGGVFTLEPDHVQRKVFDSIITILRNHQASSVLDALKMISDEMIPQEHPIRRLISL